MQIYKTSGSERASLVSGSVLKIAALFWATMSFSLGQTQIQFEPLALREGLSQVTVNFIQQDSQGYIWVGTDDGLNLYNGYGFKVFTNTPYDPDSLSDNSIKAWFEDEKGTLWIGTFSGGLNRFNRHEETFSHFLHQPGNQESLSHNQIFGITGDSENLFVFTAAGGVDLFRLDQQKFTPIRRQPGNKPALTHDRVTAGIKALNGDIWIGTQNGLNHIHKSTLQIDHLFFNPGQEPPSTSQVRSLALGPDEGVWVGMLDGRIARVDSQNRVAWINQGNPLLPENKPVLALFEDRTSGLWFGSTQGELYFWDQEKETLKQIASNSGFSGPRLGFPVTQIIQDKQGGIWSVWAAMGLFHFSPDTQKLTCFQHKPGYPNSLNTDVVNQIFEDQAGTLWVGTGDNGVNIYDPQKGKFDRQSMDPFDSRSLGSTGVRSFLKESESSMWVGTQFGGLDLWDRASGVFSHFKNDPNDPESLSSDDVRIIFRNQDGTLWVGTNGGGLNKFTPGTGKFRSFLPNPENPNSLINPSVRDIIPNGDGRLWIGTQGGLDLFDPKTSVFQHIQRDSVQTGDRADTFIVDLFMDRESKLWMATFGGGLKILDRETLTFKEFRHDEKDPNSLSHNSVLGITQARDGRIWVGTWGGGLNLYHAETDTFEHFSTRDGLPNNVVYGILEDTGGQLWMSTNHGISQFDPKSREFRNFDMEDGLQSNEFNMGAFYQNDQGEMFFGGVAGFNHFFPERVQSSHNPPKLIFSVIKIRDKVRDRNINISKNYTLKYDENQLSFEFSAQDFTNSHKNQYAYQLTGVDPDWVYCGGRRYTSYANLLPGEYTFKLKAANQDGIWSTDELGLTFLIQPPFWQLWWFYGLELVLALLILVFLAFLQRKRLIKQKNDALMALDLKRKTEELEYARKIQKSLLPDLDSCLGALDITGKMEPAAEVGGDYYDFFKLGPSKCCLAWGDATGHGLSSGIIVGMTKSALTHGLKADPAKSPLEMLITLNQTLKSSIPEKNLGMCLGLVKFDFQTKTMEISSAGMPFPYHFNRATGKLTSLKLKCPPLGFMEELPGMIQNHSFRKEDIFIFLSDGLEERMNDQGEFWGEPTLHACLETICQEHRTSEQIADQLLVACDAFAGGCAHQDDMTVVVVRMI